MKIETFPFIVGWELTLQCNLRCHHCGSNAGGARPRELTLEESLLLCDQFPSLLVQEVDFTGGEPLLSPYWYQLAERLTASNICVKILTNGLAMDSETALKIKDAGITAIGYSIDGLEKTHDSIRGKDGLFGKVLKSLEQTSKAGIPATVITTVCDSNIDELHSLLSVLLKAGVTSWQMQPLFKSGRASENAGLQLSELTLKRFDDFLKTSISISEKLGIKIEPADSFGYFSESETKGVPWRGCPAGILSCGITSDGKVKGCLSLPDNSVEGDLRTRDLWDIWFDPASFSYSRNDITDSLGANCRDCTHSIQCRGGCSAMSYAYTGRFHNDPFCIWGFEHRKQIT